MRIILCSSTAQRYSASTRPSFGAEWEPGNDGYDERSAQVQVRLHHFTSLSPRESTPPPYPLQNVAFCTQCTGRSPRTVATLKGTRKIAERNLGPQRNFENASTFFHICDTLISSRIPASRPMPATGEEPN